MSNNFYSGTGLIGGGSGALDAIDGTALADKDAAMIQTDGIVYFYHLDATSGAAESSPTVIEPDTNSGNKRWILQNVGGVEQSYVRLHDSKATGTAGGTFTQDAWQKRTCTEDIDVDEICTVASSVIVLAAGTYDIYATLSAYDVRRHRGRLRNTTAGTTLVTGSNEYSSDVDNGAAHSTVIGRFTVAAAQNLEIQHQCTFTKADNGWGLGVGTGENEIYLIAEFRKIS